MRRTKIVCTIGPSTESIPKLREIIQAGVDVIRLNYSHESPEKHKDTAQNIRTVAAEFNRPVAILQDLPGPKIRLGTFGGGGVTLHAGDLFTLTTRKVEGTQKQVSVNYPKLVSEVHPGQMLLLADGSVELKIESIVKHDLHCRVLTGGVLTNHKGVNVPRGALTMGAFTKEDRCHLLAGLEAGVDITALSFVRSPADIHDARNFLAKHKTSQPLMAKIEKPEALDVLDEIISVVDAVMVARGDLGVEIPAAEVPLVQKDIIAKSIEAAKPVVTATQMLRSMVENPRPTRAEAADVANAVLDGTDALMLSEETAVGDYPVEAVRTMAEIAERAEQRMFMQRPFTSLPPPKPGDLSEAVGHAACLLAYSSGAQAIICCTREGRSARLVAKHRPTIPIIAVSPNERTVHGLMLTWGVFPIQSPEFKSMEAMIKSGLELAQSTRLVSVGKPVVVVGSTMSDRPRHLDFLRVSSLP